MVRALLVGCAAGLLGVAMVLSSAVALSPPVPACRSYADGEMISGGGAQELRVIAGTVSPNGKLGIGWRAPADENNEVADSYLVRLKDGATLAPLHGEIRWGTKEQLANHVSVNARWNADSSAVVEAVSAKWEMTSLKLYAVSASGGVGSPVNLMPALDQALRAKLKNMKADGDAYVFDFANGVKTRAADGAIVLPIIAQVPKSERDPDFRFDVTVAVDARDDQSRIASIRLRKN